MMMRATGKPYVMFTQYGEQEVADGFGDSRDEALAPRVTAERSGAPRNGPAALDPRGKPFRVLVDLDALVTDDPMRLVHALQTDPVLRAVYDLGVQAGRAPRVV